MVWAIGDVHGCLLPLRKLIDELSPSQGDKLIFLGDYVDRGPDSKGVVDFLLDLSRQVECIFVRGNHEDMLLEVLDEGADPYLWLLNGAQATWRSYGNLELMRVEEAHLGFFRSTKLYHIETVGDREFLFVHAGVRPGIPLERQREEDIIWIREEFISRKHGLPYTVVFGHTPFENVYFGPDKLGVDTGCVYGGALSAVCLNNLRTVQVVCKNA